jgi:AbrB family looped-hinge helix DNA binding protein
VGIKMGETLIDKRGRIVIPKEVREKLNLKSNQRLLVQIRRGEIVLKPSADAGKFITELKGCVKGSRVKPSELKEIWGIAHAHH